MDEDRISEVIENTEAADTGYGLGDPEEADAGHETGEAETGLWEEPEEPEAELPEDSGEEPEEKPGEEPQEEFFEEFEDEPDTGLGLPEEFTEFEEHGGQPEEGYGLGDDDYEEYEESEEHSDVMEVSPEEQEIRAIEDRIERRQREHRDRNSRKKARFWAITSAVLLAAALMILSLSGVFTVEYIEVRGNSYFSAEEIINIGHAVPGKNLIYHPDKKEISKYLEQNPYIKSARVKRKLPSTLVIEVEERSEVCALPYDDDFLVLDDEGVLLRKTRTEPHITMVRGLVVNKIRLGQEVGTTDPERFGKVLGILKSMRNGDMFFIRLELEDEDVVRAYIYESFLVKTDSDTLIANLDNGHLHRAVEELFSKDIKRGTITFSDNETASFEPGLR